MLPTPRCSGWQRARATVMLSAPPALLAASTSTWHILSSGESASTAARISSSSTMPDRPSEHASRTSPGSTGSITTSTCTWSAIPSARVMTLRCWKFARSSGLIRPVRSRSFMSEWSTVTCRSAPPRQT